jgi:SAM-dependent methyltransferase
MREIHPGIEVWGVDVHAGEGVPEFYEYRVADLDAGLLPHPDATFDAVVFMHVIEHLRSPLRLGPEIARVMKPGGRLYVEAPNRTFVLVPSFSFCRGQHNPFNVVGAEYSLETGLVEFLDVPGRD